VLGGERAARPTRQPARPPQRPRFTAAPLTPRPAAEGVVCRARALGTARHPRLIGAWTLYRQLACALHRPAPGEPALRPGREKHNAWRVGGAACGRPVYDPARTSSSTARDAFRAFDPSRPATTCSPRAPSRSTPTPARSCGSSRRRPTNWDFDTPSPKMLYEVNIKAKTKGRRELSRNGYYYTLDRSNGPVHPRRPISGEDHWRRDRSEDRKPSTTNRARTCRPTPHRRAARQARRRACRGGTVTEFFPRRSMQAWHCLCGRREGCISGTAKTPWTRKDMSPAAVLHEQAASPPRRALGDDLKTGKISQRTFQRRPSPDADPMARFCSRVT